MVKKLFTFALAIILISNLCGCSLSGINIKELMAVPKANSDQQAIFNLLKNDDGSVNYAYPKSGEYRSAIIMHNFTDDLGDGAIGFCKNSDGSGITAKFMCNDKTNGWHVLSSIKNPATQVDRVVFGDMTGDGIDEVIVGWGSPQSMTASICIYTYKDGSITEYPLNSFYSEMTLTDFTGDGVAEIFTATVNTQTTDDENSTQADGYARIYSFKDDHPIISHRVKLIDSMVRYTGASFSKIPSGKSAVILDGVWADNSTSTQILTYDIEKDTLLSPLSLDDMVEKYNYFFRPSTVPLNCKDISEDGFIEIPYITLSSGHTASILHPSTNYLTDWVRFNTTTNEVISILPTIMNIDENYYVELPQAMKYDITSYNDSNNRELVFYKINLSDTQVTTSQKLFSIRTYTHSDWRTELETGNGNYKLLKASQSDMVYAVRIFSEETLSKVIIDSFEFISE